MRKVKFRCWYENEMFHGLPLEEILELSLNKDYEFDIREVKKAIFLQYTGIKDKNGVEIYEGDIVRLRGGVLCQVKWFDHGFFMFAVGDDYGSGPLHESVYVIGNTYENPELLE